MNKIKRILKINVLAVLLFGFLTVGVYSADSKPVADEMIGSSGISWAPKVNYSRLELTISRPDGTVFSKTFNSGSSLYASLSEIFGDSYLDGSYNYELRVTPVLDRASNSVEVDRYSVKAHEALTQSGAFFVRGGAIVDNDILEPGSEAAAGSISGAQDGLSGVQDIVHLDDVIIQFSACVGNDCVNGESFGFDTLRLKENNLRIHFQDTSTSASFPSNDWRIVINDTSNGGANYFAVEDSNTGRQVFKILAAAPANSLYVDAQGDVGLGTSNPVVNAHIVDGNTPTLRLEQDGSSGFTPQTWDVGGNEANFFVRDVTNGSKLSFRIKPGAPEDSIFIDTDGVGFGTDNPGFPIHLKTNSSTNAVILAEKASGATNFMNATATHGVFGTTSDHNLRFVRQSVPQMDLIGDSDITMADGGGYNGTWNDASSRELKENIKDLTVDAAMEALAGLTPVTYNYKADKEEAHVGFIAEDVPELVAKKDRKSLSPMDIVSVLTKVVQDQQKSLQEQQKINAELEKKIAELGKNSK